MEENDDQKYKFTIGKLEKCSYRNLQQKAKALHLPSNYKKIYLIQLIHTHYFGSEQQVQSIVKHVRTERQLNKTQKTVAPRTRKSVQGPEISSTNESSLQSPPITMTPRRIPTFTQYGPNLSRSLIKPDYHESPVNPRAPFVVKNTHNGAKNFFGTVPQPSSSNKLSYISVPGTSYKIAAPKSTTYIPNTMINPCRRNTTAPLQYTVVKKKPETDRVLRNRTYPTANQHRPEKYKEDSSPNNSPPQKYSTVVNLLRSRKQNPVSNELRLLRRTEDSNVVPSNSLIKRAVAPSSVEISQGPSPAKRQRILSGIYPIDAADPKPKVNYQFVQGGLGIRNANGTYSKINVLVRKPVQKAITARNKIQPLLTTYKSPKQTQTTYEIIVDDDDEEPEVQTLDFNTQDVIAKTVSNAYKTQENFISHCSMNTVTHTQTSTPVQTYCVTQPDYAIEETPISNAKEIFPNEETPISNEREIFTGEEMTISNEKDFFANEDDFTTYFHKKIRSEQVRSRRESLIGCRKENQRDEPLLPRIHEVFSSFNNVAIRRMTEPIYVQVGESGRYAYPPQEAPRPAASQNVSMLETLYNFRTVFLTNTPLPTLATTCNTTCVYSTPVLTTAMAQTSKFEPNAQVNMVSAPNNINRSEDLAKDDPNSIYNYLSQAPDDTHTNSHSTTHSLEMLASQVTSLHSSTLSIAAADSIPDLVEDAAESIPDMVEDALELISQDGDYMERIEMDEGMQCVLCSWAGPRILLEHHIRQDHAQEIIQIWSDECRVTLTLSQLERTAARVLQRGASLLMLNASLDGGTCLEASLHSLSYDEESCEVGTLTVYNVSTGEPFTWTGLIPSLTTAGQTKQTLQVELSKLDLDSDLPWDRIQVGFYVRV